jgi:hypothetical protein
LRATSQAYTTGPTPRAFLLKDSISGALRLRSMRTRSRNRANADGLAANAIVELPLTA